MTLAKKLASIMSALSWRQRRVEAELRESELRFRQVTENISEVFFLCDPEITHIFYISPGYAEIWGRSCGSLYADPKSFADAIHVDDRERAMQTIAPQGTVVPCDVEYRIVRPDGTVRWVRARTFPIRDERGDIYRFAGIAEDITERKSALDQITRQAQVLEQNNRRLSLLGEMTGLLQTVVKVEEAAAIVGGYAAQVQVGDGGAIYLFKESRNALDLLARWGELTLADSIAPDECWALRRGQPYRPPGAQPALRCKHVQQVDGPSTYLCLPMMAEGGALGLLHVGFADEFPATREDDALFAQRMSEQLGLALANFRLRETLRFEAMQDPLTRLYNRRFLEISLKREFARAARENNSVAVMMLDVDHFKRFNDTHGHDAGDVVLRQFGQILMENCRAADLACRFGGEEFTVVIPGATREATTEWAERLLGSVRDMKAVADWRVLPPITVSIGIAFFPEHGEETTKVIQAADQALYAAKEAGRDRYVFSTQKPGSAGGVGQEMRGGAE
jgi:diguanylate cyclase (GGDEF)-like protein/PAS domain S-box-containing protein